MSDESNKTDRVKKDDQPKRLVLNKRVIKHLVVKSNVKTGLSAYCTDGACGIPGTRCCTNHNAAKVLRRH